jgi:peptidoglycan/LPS O-acetylase OafA/YrhL
MAPLFWAMACTWLIDRAAVGFTGPVGRFLESRPMITVGRVSYGLYVYHMIIPFLLDAGFERMGWQPIAPGWNLIGLWVVLTFAAAMLSWQFYEMPINNLRRLMDAGGRPSGRVVPVVAVAG